MDKGTTSSLVGKRIVITRAARQSGELAENLTSLAHCRVCCRWWLFPRPKTMARWMPRWSNSSSFDWIIFTSENAVRAVVKRASVRGNLRNVAGRRSRAAAVGPTTAAAAERAGFSVDYRAKTHSGAALANELGERVRNQTIFLPRSDRANPDLPGLLRAHGAQVTEVVAYRTVTPVNLDREKIARHYQRENGSAFVFQSHGGRDIFPELPAIKHLSTCSSAWPLRPSDRSPPMR